MTCRKLLPWLLLTLVLVQSGCKGNPQPQATVSAETVELPDTLSALGLFEGNLREQRPAVGVLPYDLNSPLFSDYTLKYRFIKLPPGTQMKYVSDDVSLEFPVGTMIAKTFAYPHDQRDVTRGQTLIETRILRRGSTGWDGVSYVWNHEQTEATLKLTGTVVPSRWTHFDGAERTNAYIVPNANQCKSCHGLSNDPIGPKPRNLDRDFVHTHGPGNQLSRWIEQKTLTHVADRQTVKKLPVWNDERTGSLDERARAWLDINCAHCHQPTGSARQSGLDLRYVQTDAAQRGMMKIPVAAGRGSGGRSYDIVPGKPDESILVFRLESTEPGVMMPELPRRMIDREGVELIRTWISSMK